MARWTDEPIVAAELPPVLPLHHPESRWPVLHKLIFTSVVALAMSGCAALEGLRGIVQAPPAGSDPLGPSTRISACRPGSCSKRGAGVRLWTRVSNPNPFGLTLGTLRGTLHLEDSRAADVDFPLGLPLRAREESTIPIDLSISFADLPGLANVVRRAVSRQPLEYHLEGTIGVDAGQLGQPTFGPMTLLRGELRGVQ